jgi:hypothetical protein
MPFDTLKLARRLEGAGFPPKQAGDMSEAIAEALGNLATKDDLVLLKADLQQEIGKLGGVVGTLEVRWVMLMWAVGINVALTVAILGVLLRGSGHGP